MKTIDKTMAGLLALSILLNLALAFKVHSLRAAVTRTELIAVGAKIGEIRVRTSAGAPVTLSFDHAPRSTVLYILSRTCTWSARNLASIKNLAGLGASQYRFRGISLRSEGLSEYLAAAGYPFEVYTDVRDDDLRKYHLGSTPETIVVDRGGKVVKAWIGAYQDSVKDDVDRFFGRPSDSAALRRPKN